MQPERRDAALLWDMAEAARRAVEFIHDKTFDDYRTSSLVQYAVERAIEILGEAANRVSREFQEAHPEIPWRQMVGQRNVLIHEYGDVDHALVWSVVQKHIPALLAQIEPLLPHPPTAE
jgi:uncharacterized protein with HEPN domain